MSVFAVFCVIPRLVAAAQAAAENGEVAEELALSDARVTSARWWNLSKIKKKKRRPIVHAEDEAQVEHRRSFHGVKTLATNPDVCFLVPLRH
jgi:hypothetical protein